MSDISFSIDFRAALIVLLFGGFCYLLNRWSKIFQIPHIKFSSVSLLKQTKPGLRGTYPLISRYLLFGALGFFALALVDPHFYLPKKQEEKEKPPLKQVNVPTEGIAMYLVLDQSGSMAQEIKGYTSGGQSAKLTKMDLLRQVTRDFVAGNPETGLKGRPNDLLGLVAFARGTQVLSPLTLDHQMILDQLEKLKVNTDEDQDGTSIGYAIFKTANLIAATRHYAKDLAGEGEPAYDIKSTVMILVTDGFQSPNPLDKGKRLRNMDIYEAADFSKQNDIRLYIINVEPRIASDEFAAYRKIMKNAAEITGGQFFLVDSSRGLDVIYADIDRLEKSVLPVESQYVIPKSQLPNLYDRISLFPFLITLGMLCLALSVVFEGILMRRVP